jgi:hypothetical protein
VGAISAHCQPASMQAAAASAATTVLPEPTSPCSSRCMGTGGPGRARSRRPRAAARRSARRAATGQRQQLACRARNGTKRFGATMRQHGRAGIARTRLACSCESCCASSSSAFQALPGRVAVVLQRLPATHRASGDAKMIAPRAGSTSAGGHFGHGHPAHGGMVSDSSAAPAALPPPCAGTAWGRPATVGYTGVSAVGSATALRNAGVHHGPAQKAALDLAAQPHAHAHRQRFLLRG